MPAGRPTKYNPEVQAKADAYLENHQQRVPTNVGLALELDVSDKTLDNWRDAHPEFLRTLERIKAKQHLLLIDGGIGGEFNATITKLILATNHGYADKSDNTLTGPNGGPVPVQWVVDANTPTDPA